MNLPRLFPHGASLLLGLVLLLGPWAAGLYLKGHAWTHSAGEPLRVVAIQGNIAQELKWDPNQVRAQLDLYRDLSLPQQDVDLIVWPETAVPILQDMASGYLGAMGQVADEKNAALITGVPVRERLADGKSRYFNGITVVGGAGTYPSRSWCRSASTCRCGPAARPDRLRPADVRLRSRPGRPAAQGQGLRDRPVHLLAVLPGVAARSRRRARCC